MKNQQAGIHLRDDRKKQVDIIIAGYTGLWETGEILKQKREELSARFPESFLRETEGIVKRFSGLDKQEGIADILKNIEMEVPLKPADSEKPEDGNPERQEKSENEKRRSAIRCFPADHGLEQALWRAGEAAGCGLEADISRIPIRQETIEIAEYYDLNPYRLDSPGVWVILTENGPAVLQRLKPLMVAAAAGVLTEGHDRVFLYDHGRERRFLEPRGSA